MGNTVIKTLAIALPVSLALGWWLGLNHSEGHATANFSANATVAEKAQVVARDSAINDAFLTAEAAALPSTALENALGTEQSQDLTRRFNQANAMFETGRLDESIAVYQKLTADFPHFVEPYVNLAAALAQRGDLQDARRALQRGVQANQSTQSLYESLSTLNGALAAQAYRQALETADAPPPKPPVLPIAKTLSTDYALHQQINLLVADLSLQAEQRNAIAANESASLNRLAELKAQNAALESTLKEAQSSHQIEQTELRLRLQVEQENVERAQSQLTRYQREAEQAEQDLIAKLRIELANKDTLIAQFKQDNTALADELNVLRQRLQADAPVLASAGALADTDSSLSKDNSRGAQPTNDVPESADNAKQTIDLDEASAVELVKNWAAAWSAQDVDRYVDFYAADYTPSASVTHQQWLEQRRVRLTNKWFIEIKLSDFQVAPLSDGFSVMFSQHYRSNTLDDTITKKLTFFTGNEVDLSRAKIVDETIVRR